MKKTKKNEEWTKKDEETYQELCFDDYDEEACTNFVYRHDDAEFDYGIDEEEREKEEAEEE
jgi:hypothetical protein